MVLQKKLLAKNKVFQQMPTLGPEETNQGKQHELRDLFFEASLKVAREGELLQEPLFCPQLSLRLLSLCLLQRFSLIFAFVDIVVRLLDVEIEENFFYDSTFLKNNTSSRSVALGTLTKKSVCPSGRIQKPTLMMNANEHKGSEFKLSPLTFRDRSRFPSFFR